jgi:hypothetical protein
MKASNPWENSYRGVPDRERKNSSVTMPRHTVGKCKFETCKTVDDLANGVCVAHWDKGMDTRSESHVL